MARPVLDLSLYLVIGRDDTRGRDLVSVVRAAVAGGVTLVQIREKALAPDDLLASARALKAVLDPAGVPLLVNDRIEEALAAKAAGLHLGQDDRPAAEARRALGPDAIIGISAGDLTEAATVDPAIVDYVGIGPAFVTGTKADAGAAIGPEGVAEVRRAMGGLPSVAIGGITAETAPAVLATGVDGIVVVSAIAGADDPEAAARELRALVAAQHTGR